MGREISMNATFGNYSPAQYAYQDNTISSIGNRFANVAEKIPGLIREGIAHVILTANCLK